MSRREMLIIAIFRHFRQPYCRLVVVNRIQKEKWLQESRDRYRDTKLPRRAGGGAAPSSRRDQYVEKLLVRSTLGDGGAYRRCPWRSRSDARRTCATLRTCFRGRRNDLRRDRRHRPGSASKVRTVITTTRPGKLESATSTRAFYDAQNVQLVAESLGNAKARGDFVNDETSFTLI